MPTTRAVRLHAFGDAAQGVRVEDLPIPEPGRGAVLVRMQRAVIHPADLNVIEGSYGRLPALPAIIGNEGVGEVVAGDALPAGLRVRPLGGCWSEWVCVEAARCLPIPGDLPLEQAAQLSVNPATAWAVLHEYRALLEPGSWVLVNAPASALARSLTALCHARGLRVAGLVRDPAEAPHLDRALLSERDSARPLRELGARLALNLLGGDSAALLARGLAEDGVLVTVGALARAPLALPNGPLIFGELRCHGFWLSRWYGRAPRDLVQRMLGELADLVRAGQLRLPVAAVYPLDAIHAALAHAARRGRGGKVLLDLTAS
ncbi:MAG: zinc-dependent alcohol dehydrogenase family protein [Planctomycetota bacterium]|nr:zinc-dependent alcohol dehydrogenase family protein [Planctomycetota bacterium]MCX8039352.1 zinc-dependent alcohol dehydrogenase family protein [Planctomycetota bacterium]MDW8373643.1 zinc-dependent alcohol dehydrogenase family protein [Planctomycetota bacterium]